VSCPPTSPPLYVFWTISDALPLGSGGYVIVESRLYLSYAYV
jgi:hypothetical protein